MKAIISRSARLAVALAILTASADAQEPVASVPFRSPSNLIILEGAIGESGPMTFLLDSGAGRTVLDAPVVDSLGLRVTGQGRAVGASGAVPVRVVANVPVRLGGVELLLPTAVAFPFAELEPALGMDADAVVGHELFMRYVVQIDYAAGTLRLFDPATFVAPQAPWLPLTVRGNAAFVPVRIDVDGRTLEARLRLDTGSGGAVTLTAPFVRAHGLASGTGLTSGASWGVGGRSREVNRVLERLTLGELALQAPTATLSQDTAGVLSGSEGDGLLGGEVLRRFTVTLDYGRGRMYLQPNARLDEPFRRGLAGMGIFALPPDFRTFRLTHVDEGSPAAAAGLRADDVIEAVDGRPAGEMDLQQLRDLFRLPGTSYTLTIRRGDERIEARIVLPTP
ncbi:MAG TPA: aspartyl protease family protein [Longimicrobium sp.]|jgi:predicted aspartyl protease|nr:aspartyl protease family protein [Longimicrobium sp.]